MSYRAGIVGAAGFTGAELIRLLSSHPDFSLEVITSDSLRGSALSSVYPAFEGVSNLVFCGHDEADFSSCEVVFLAVPHTVAQNIAPGLIEQGVSVIDLSADFRLKDPAVYEKWYGTPHTAPAYLSQAFFGLPEVARDEIESAAEKHLNGFPVLIGCAGCYPTATSLAAAPAIRAGLTDSHSTVVVDAISGVTGAGKKPTERTHFCSADENLEAYSAGTHRHTPEIEQILGLEGRLVFTPHLAPLNRGLLSTVNMPLSPDVSLPSISELESLYEDFYASSTLVSVIHAPCSPRTSSVAWTSRAHVGVAVQESAHMIIGIGAIDNLGKGAAGQAIQCANIVFGLSEETGLDCISSPV